MLFRSFTCNPDLEPAHALTLVCKSAFLSGEFFQNHISVSVRGDDSIVTLSAVTTGYLANYNGALNAFGVQLRYRDEESESSVSNLSGVAWLGLMLTQFDVDGGTNSLKWRILKFPDIQRQNINRD